MLLVVASTGTDDHGKNRLRVVRVDAALPGVTRRPMPDPPFAPEIAHDEIDLEGVIVREDDLLPGDGFDRYVRPFRTVEDIHVQAAVYAYLIREIRAEGLPPSLAERFAALLSALGSLAAASPSEPAVHVALAGVLALARGSLDELEQAWAQKASPSYARWERDRPLLSVASKARSSGWRRPGRPSPGRRTTRGDGYQPSISAACCRAEGLRKRWRRILASSRSTRRSRRRSSATSRYASDRKRERIQLACGTAKLRRRAASASVSIRS